MNCSWPAPSSSSMIRKSALVPVVTVLVPVTLVRSSTTVRLPLVRRLLRMGTVKVLSAPSPSAQVSRLLTLV